MNRKTVIISGIVLILVILGYWKINKPTTQIHDETKIHYHAGFVVFENLKKVDFSDIKYMSIAPCKVHGSTGSPQVEEMMTAEEEQKEKAHLHDGVGDVVHVHVKDSKWGDLFTNIKYQVDYSKVTAYINGQKVEDIKDYPTKSYDGLVLFIGKVDEKLTNQAVTIDHIKDAESKSENCGN